VGCQLASKGIDTRQAADAKAGDPAARIGANQTVPVPMTTPSSAPAAMVWIPGGTFLMGSDDHYPEEAPAHHVTVDGFWIDRHTVTNAKFARFVHKTGHLTVAERAADPVTSFIASGAIATLCGRSPRRSTASRPSG